MRFSAEEIARATGGVVHGDGAASGVVLTDSRAALSGAFFLALVGDRFDAHDFLDAVMAAPGVVGGVFSRDPGPSWRLPWVHVQDTTRALQDLGRAARARVRVPVVGLTGSNGKTTTRALTSAALKQLGAVHQTVGNLNNHLGVPMTLCATPDGAGAVVVEMGTSSPGEIAVLADIATPNVRLIVNVGPAHLEELGGLAGVAVEKGALFRSAGSADVCVVNLDDPFLAQMPVPGRRVTWCGPNNPAQADVRLLSSVTDPEQLFTIARFATPDGEVSATLRAPGEHVAHNAAGALAVAWALGLDLRVAAADLASFAPVGMRLAVQELPRGVRAINDAYNANPGSMRTTLAVLAGIPARLGARVAVLGDMLELGVDEAALHDEVATYACGLGLDLVVLVGPRMSKARAPETGAVWRAEDGLGLVPALAARLKKGDQVVFKGSRGARVERVLEALQAELGKEVP